MLGEWNKIEADFQQHYGIDLSDPGVRHHRSWRWFKVRLGGLLSIESRLQSQFNPTPEQKKRQAKE
jgi:hypothetical protein